MNRRLRRRSPARVPVDWWSRSRPSGLRKAAEKSAPPTQGGSAVETEPRIGRSASAEVGSIETPVTEVSSRPGPDESAAEGPVEEAEGVERALRDGDDAAILKALHVEVTEIADGMLRRDPKHGHLVWEVVGRRGWFDEHREEFELDPLERFYRSGGRASSRPLHRGRSPANSRRSSPMSGFSKMLLELREMFLNARSRV